MIERESTNLLDKLCAVHLQLKVFLSFFASINWYDKHIKKISTGKLQRIPYSLLTNFHCTFQREFASIHSITKSKGQVYCFPYKECPRGDLYADNRSRVKM